MKLREAVERFLGRNCTPTTLGEFVKEAEAALAEPVDDEPVAWRYRYSTKGRWQYADDPANDPAVIEEPLYTRPAAAPAELARVSALLDAERRAIVTMLHGSAVAKWRGYQAGDTERLMQRLAAAPAERGESATIMALVEDYAKAVHDGDDNSCAVLQRTIRASIEQLCADQAERGEYPPLPTICNEIGDYSADQMRAYVDADRAQRVPLLQREIFDLWDDARFAEGSSVENFARAIERAHGIGAKP